MTVNLCVVSGTLVAPDGSPMSEAELRFLPAPVSLRGQGGDTFAPRPVDAVTDAAAALSVGLAPGVYTLRAREPEGREFPPCLVDVPAREAAELSEILLHLPAPQSVYDAAASARAAANAVGRAEAIVADIAHAAPAGAWFPTRAAFEAAEIPETMDGWSLVHAGRMLHYLRDPDGTAIESANGVKGAPADEVCPEHWGALGDGVTDDTAAIQAGVDWLEAQGGGTLRFRARRYIVSATIRGRRNVWLVGEGWRFQGDFTDAALIEGSWIELAPGSDCDVVLFRAAPGEGETVRQRLHAGMRDIGVHGRRSDSFARSAVDLNASGRGIRMDGVSYVTLDNVCAFRCAEAGVSMGSYDYGGGVGLLSCNNMNWRNVLATGNAGDGFEIFGGDGTYAQLVAGFNGRHGFRVGDGPLLGCKAWNNSERGFSISSNAALIGCDSYDNGRTGVHVAAKDVRVMGGEIRTNGTAQLATARDRAGLFLAPDAQDVVIDGNTIDNKPGKTPTQQIGILCETPGVRIALGGNTVRDNTVANIDIADPVTAQLHGSIARGDLRHPGFTVTGHVDLDNHVLARAKAMTFSVWGNVAFADGVLNVGANSAVFVNIAGGATVTELAADTSRGIPLVIVRNAAADPLTFQHANNRLRLAGGVNRTLARNEAILFVWVTGSVWQQVG